MVASGFTAQPGSSLARGGFIWPGAPSASPLPIDVVQVLLDDGSNTFPYDITTFCRMTEGITGARGRQDELSQVTAPQPTLVLDNVDGRFSYGSTIIASPSPILVDQKVRVRLTANGTTVNRYTGTLIAGNVSFPGGGDEFAIVTVALADQQAQAERRPLRSVIEEEYALDFPIAVYTHGESAGALGAGDSSGNASPILAMTGVGASVAFGASGGPSTDSLTAASFSGGKYLAATIASLAQWSVNLFFSTTSVGGSAVIATFNGIPLTINAGVVSFNGVPETTALNDGKAHAYCITVGAYTGVSNNVLLYVDGTQVDAQMSSVLPGLTSITVGGPGGFTGAVAQLGLFGSVLSGRMITYALAGSVGFDPTLDSLNWLNRLVTYASLPVGTVDLANTPTQFAAIDGKSVMAVITDVVDAAFGLVFFDGSGNLTFHNRNRAVGKVAPDITIDANQLDPGTAFYYDALGILNYVTVTAQGTQVTQVARNKVSELGAAGSPKHGRYSDSKTYLVQTDAEALDRGNWLVGTHGQPAPRVPSLVIDLLTMTPAQQAAWLTVEPDTWLRITGLPAQTHGGTTADLIVEGWSEVLNATTWTLALNTASRPAFFQAWILDDNTYSVLGSTTKLYV